MKAAPDAVVRDWLDEQVAETVYLSSVTIAELTFCIGTRPKDRRKDRLTAAFDDLMSKFGERILPFDTETMRRYGDLAVRARVTDDSEKCANVVRLNRLVCMLTKAYR